jgi:putative transcriptional regulator
MANVSAALVRRLHERTGADLSTCRKALEAAAGDFEKAEAQLLAELAELDEIEDDDADDDDANSLKSQFLIAMPSLEDDNFSHTVSLLCEHNDRGAIGLVINRPTDLTLTAMLDQMGVKHEGMTDDQHVVVWGGPVQPERGFVVHAGPGGWESCMPIGHDLYITTSRDVLAAIGEGQGPSEFLVTLGYAGWGAGQLESEILQNSWLNTPVDSKVLFKMPARDRWQQATRLLGLDVTQLASGAGHA